MLRLIRRPLFGFATLFSILCFLYQFLELSNENLVAHQQGQDNSLVLQYTQQIASDQTGQNDSYSFREKPTWGNGNASNSQLTHWGSTSPDRNVDVLTRWNHKAAEIAVRDDHEGPIDLSNMTPSGTESRLPSTCPGSVAPWTQVSNSNWQTVVPHQSYVFSAFREKRNGRNAIKIIGTADTRKIGRPKYCQIWFSNGSQPLTFPVIDEVVPETHNMR